MALQLRLDPTGVEIGAARAKSAIDQIVAAASRAEDATGPMFGPMNKGIVEAQQRFNGLRASLDPVYAATMRYATAVEQVEDALRAQAITQQEATHAAGLAKTQYDRAVVSAQQIEKSAFAAGGGMRNLGQQLSQVGQQGAITGDYLGALAIQLPDMALGFGSVAIAASIVATIAMPLIIDAFGGGKTAAEQLADATDTLGNSISALHGITSDLSNLDELKKKYGEIDTQLLTLIGHQRQEQMLLADTAASNAVTALRNEYASLLHSVDDFGRTGYQAQVMVKDQLGLTVDQAHQLRDAMDAAADATDFAGKTAALAQIDAILSKSKINGGEFANAVTKAALALREVKTAADASEGAIAGAAAKSSDLGQYLQDAWDNMVGVSATAPNSGWLSGAISDAETLAANLWNAATASGSISQHGIKIGASAAPGESQDGLALPTPGIVQPPVVTLNIPAVVHGGGGGGGGADPVAATQKQYDALMASLDPAIAASQKLAAAQKTISDEMANGAITTAEAARAFALVSAQIGDTAGAWDDLNSAGSSAIDSLIDGTKTLSESLQDMAKELGLAAVKALALQHITGATSSMSLGGLAMAAITGGFHDAGGTIPNGTTGVVGERGPELVTAGRNGAVVTSRVDTARMMQGGGQQQQAMHVTVGISFDDEMKPQAYVKKMSQAAAHTGAANAVQTVKRNLGSWNGQLQLDGAL